MGAAWTFLHLSGQFTLAVHFIVRHPTIFPHMVFLMVASACGCYACTVTVKLFGPAVFTLLLMSHQMLSIIASIVLFHHKVDTAGMLCVVVVAMLILTSCIRRVSNSVEAYDEKFKLPLQAKGM